MHGPTPCDILPKAHGRHTQLLPEHAAPVGVPERKTEVPGAEVPGQRFGALPVAHIRMRRDQATFALCRHPRFSTPKHCGGGAKLRLYRSTMGMAAYYSVPHTPHSFNAKFGPIPLTCGRFAGSTQYISLTCGRTNTNPHTQTLEFQCRHSPYQEPPATRKRNRTGADQKSATRKRDRTFMNDTPNSLKPRRRILRPVACHLIHK